mmetsp:Transcript_45156/g.66218  ORF Transcript_45156/g.66218 Transcript_45156/m.66218 type:complete len:483 (+) Transcript_45156:78-1526(+)|eukprot:CAMPEP_0179442644 /NCGR_PEP_ID=MMETSP0799-20121207/26138_1 /TAXON_ID=46947 /ORGANISM="Geminigera cryophila, Strain CCMP2564" /LENGTH=482 /DNA_ID=CAMNT_0021227989 /DNA_START=48 /DNA_END=1496 /DNA_ORIENTATION=-
MAQAPAENKANSEATNEFATAFHNAPLERVLCIGAGSVGVSTMALMATKMPDVRFTVFDDDPAVICGCQSGALHFYEPGMRELVNSLRTKNLHFSPAFDESVRQAQVVFVCINTPLKTSGVGSGRAADLSGWESMARRIAGASKGECKIVVECSTIPVTTGETMRKVLHAVGDAAKYEVLCFPSFYRGGQAIKDLEVPPRVLLGCQDTPSALIAQEAVTQLISRWIPRENIVHSNLWSAELSKLAQNAMKAQRISSANAVSALCERTGADLDEVMSVVGSDSRIGPGYLKACPGMGGPTLMTNLSMLVYICESMKLHAVAEYWQQVMTLNDYQQQRFCTNIVDTMVNVKGKKIAMLGFAYKPDTSDCRQSPAIAIAKAMREEGARLAIYDPQVTPEVISGAIGADISSLQVTMCKSAMEAVEGAHALVLVTDWECFRSLDMPQVYAAMEKPAYIFDSRGAFDNRELNDLGFVVYRIGKPNLR